MALSKEDMARAEAMLKAEEIETKKKWCALKGHKWDRPAVSPFNHDISECEIICGRCDAHGTLVVQINKDYVPAQAPIVPGRTK
jgi:hypothetical protein